MVTSVIFGTLVKWCSPGEQAGRHFLQDRVFGAEGLYVALECSAGLTTRVVTLQVCR